MLILSRKAGQSILLGSDIVVTVLSVHEHQVRLGITAPRDVCVRRDDLARRIEAGVCKAGGAELVTEEHA